MSWDAGSVVGSLKLDVSDYAHGMLQAEGMMQIFPGLVTEFLENPLLGVIGLLKESVMAVVDWTKETGERFHEMGKMSENLGVTTEFISTLGAVAKAKGIDINELGMALKFLQQRAADAMNGDQSAAKGFANIGVAVSELSQLLQDPQELFYRVADGIASIENPALRVQASTELMSRAGYRMIGMFDEGADKIRQYQAQMGELGATVTSEQARMGEQWQILGEKFDVFWTAVKGELGQEIMGQVLDNTGQVDSTLKSMRQTVHEIVEDLKPLIQGVGSTIKNFDTQWHANWGQRLEILGGEALDEVSFNDIFHYTKSFRDRITEHVRQSEGRDGSINIENVNVGPVDSHRAAADIAAKLDPAIRAAALRQYGQLRAASQHSKVSHAIGGKGQSHHHDGM